VPSARTPRATWTARSKIHLKTDFDGRPLAFHQTGGEASDSRDFEVLLDIGPSQRCSATRGMTPRPTEARHLSRDSLPRECCRKTRILSQAHIRTALVSSRHRQNQVFQPHPLRCEKTAQNFATFLALVCAVSWLIPSAWLARFGISNTVFRREPGPAPIALCPRRGKLPLQKAFKGTILAWNPINVGRRGSEGGQKSG